MPYQNIARFFEQITIYNMSYQRRLILYNLLNKFLTDISALLLHTYVQLGQPYKLVPSFFTVIYMTLHYTTTACANLQVHILYCMHVECHTYGMHTQITDIVLHYTI